jgi:branched-chain amino acid transport system substrate-binding protein
MGDDVCGSSQGLAITKKLIYNDKVFAMIGLACSHVGMSIKDLLNEEKVPLIISIAQGNNILKPHSPYLFRIMPPTDLTGALMATFAHEYFKGKYKKYSLIYTQEEYGTTQRDGLIEQLGKYGLKLASMETHKIGDTDYSAQLLKIKKVNPEVLFMQSYAKDMALILKQAHELGINCIKIGCLGSDFSIIPALAGKEAVEDFYGPTTTIDAVRGPKMAAFIKMYNEAYPEYMKNPNNPSSSDVQSYIAMKIYIEALKKAGKDLTKTKFINALESMKNYQTGWIPPITFTRNDHEGLKQEIFLKHVNEVPRPLDIVIKKD